MTALAVVAPVVGALGLAIGSFLNVVAYRVPAGLSVVRPASSCPGCGAGIRSRDNVPVLGWLLLGGRCRDCRMRISARYPAIEALTGLAFVVVALVFAPAIWTAETPLASAGAAVHLVALLYLAAISIALSAIDLDVHRLPDAIVLPAYLVSGVLLAAAGLLAGRPELLLGALIGGAALFAFYFLIAFIRPGGMGFGDIKLAGVLGLHLGYAGLAQSVVGTAAAFLLGGLVAIALIIVRRAERGGGIPFGPWMLAGAWIGIISGEQIAGAYLSIVGLG
ncbi:prepilin peptidase [Homoserinibacter sp. YIM 151385]|uniref:prepilin peptidase n=1 Tax=Homoserinibacter sp. YIM 151385 TaxID=2985506 RepID=UPI0022F1106E|nr:A24 family peptidase [Homoserinibacter sp. YIM 151385]WBU37651.1 prepilin peptidase [Homoserinibacter sp. YIM 151385]